MENAFLLIKDALEHPETYDHEKERILNDELQKLTKEDNVALMLRTINGIKKKDIKIPTNG